jgi:hypothetical protein
VAKICHSGHVSVNVNLSLQVPCPSGPGAATEVVAALRQLFVQEGIDDDVVLADSTARSSGGPRTR